MKKVFIIITVVFALVALSFGSLRAQTLKFGYINSAELMQVSPDLEKVQKDMQEYAKGLELEIEELQVEYNKKVDAYQKIQAGLADADKKTREAEIQEMGRRVQEKMQLAEQDYAKKYQEMMEPVRTKILNAIKKVGKDNNFTYIFDTSSGVLSFMNESQAVNVMSLAKKELGITK